MFGRQRERLALIMTFLFENEINSNSSRNLDNDINWNIFFQKLNVCSINWKNSHNNDIWIVTGQCIKFV